jgi:site-specific DNA-adenine methylase
MKNHFFFPYAGNKRQEVVRIHDMIKDKLNGVDTIVEPFCGSCAFSVYMAMLYPKRFKYILNDNNRHLIELISISKDEEKFNNLIEELNNLGVKLNNKESYDNEKTADDLSHWVFYNSMYSIRPYLFPLTRKMNPDKFNNFKKCAFLDFIRNEEVILLNEDAINVYSQYKQNDNVLLFLDPPYLSECNDFYLSSNVNIYEYLLNNDIKNEQAFITLCLNENWIIKLLFKGCINTTYDKKYETSKKKVTHILILNK